MKRLGAALLAGAVGLGCGGSSARILERIDAAVPPGSNLRIDLFLIRSVSTCAVGPPCASRDPNQCFYLADAAGPRVTFAPDAMQFVPPGDPATMGGQPVQCFHLTLDDAAVAAAGQLAAGLRTQVFQASGGDINLDIRMHDVATIDAGFIRYYDGLFLQPAALTPVALSTVNRDTDFVYAITGYRDTAAGLQPRMDQCAGTNWLDQGVLGASTYTWLAMSDACARAGTFLGAWMVQFYFGLRDVTKFPDLYAGNYPACGRGDPDPTRWFPWVFDCSSDPDAPTCGDATCADYQAFHLHMLARHWRRGASFNGNHCSNGVMDYGETAVDSGGVCDQIGL